MSVQLLLLRILLIVFKRCGHEDTVDAQEHTHAVGCRVKERPNMTTDLLIAIATVSMRSTTPMDLHDHRS
jgi:hypothetical protein